jgi:hypothetical protein
MFTVLVHVDKLSVAYIVMVVWRQDYSSHTLAYLLLAKIRTV